MAKKKKAKAALPYVQRLVEDEAVQQQLRTAAIRLRQAYGRVSRKGGKAAEDKQLYGNLREAATSIRGAALAIRRRPQSKRRGRKLMLVGAVAGAAGLLNRGTREKLRDAVSKKQPSGNGAPQAPPTGTEASSAPPVHTG